MKKWHEVQLPQSVTLGELDDLGHVRISGGVAYVSVWRLIFLL